jgi:cysteinyl-tRNA synthetase
MLKIHNTLTRRKEPFEPIESGRVRMYVCGVTVYDYCHLGHARMLVVFDMIFRYLKAAGYEVTYVRNITDVDDKIIQRARDNNEAFADLTERFIRAMYEDTDALLIERPTLEPRATETMDAMIAMIEKLMAKGHAYQADNGDIYYSVASFEGYGKLSGKRPEQLRAGARVEVGDHKHDPLDFVLWKAAKPGEPAWPSPWGDGRPGWHIECSAMATSRLGSHFDIHGGGQDLQFPHHENEIAQSEACTGQPYANYWIHNGFVRVNEEKMSKSLGNFFTVRDILKHYRPEEVRFLIINSHYRSPLNYADEQLDSARSSLTRLYTALRGLTVQPDAAYGRTYRDRFAAAMDDDFNTPEALAVIFELAHEVNRLRESGEPEAAQAGALLRELGGVLGLLQGDPEVYLRGGGAAGGPDEAEIEAWVARRNEARKNKDFAESDRIRDWLKEQGIVLEDTPQGTVWRRM